MALGSALISSACNNSVNSSVPNIVANKKYKWKMVTTWPPNFPILGEGAVLYADWVRELSNGMMDIKVFGGGELVPPLEAFDAVTNGAVEMGSGCSYYWAGINPAFQFFASIPFGMHSNELDLWLLEGGGMDLWKEIYSRYNLVPFQAGNTGQQMGGWFNREINEIQDFKGLKMRMPGLGGKVLERVGASTVLVPGGELYISLERGVIDATEWIGPFHDYIMGFHKIAKYYYSPGWHELGTGLELFANKRAFMNLPDELKQILKEASTKLHQWVTNSFTEKNEIYRLKMVEENVDFREFTQEVLDTLGENTREVIKEITAKHEDSNRIYQHYRDFQIKLKG